MNTTKEAKIDPTYENLVNLLSVYSDGTARLAALEAETNADFLTLVDEHKGEFTRLQLTVGEAEAAIKLIAEAHPEWFPAEQRTMKTPYGTVHAQHSTKHEVPNEARTIEWIEGAIQGAIATGNVKYAERLQALIRVEKSLDLDAVGNLLDEECDKCRILRIESDSFTVKPAKVSLGGAVKAEEKKAAKKVGKEKREGVAA